MSQNGTRQLDQLFHDAQKAAELVEVPSQEELEINSRAGIIYYTFTWDSPRCERLSFGVPHVPARNFPIHMDPLFERLFKEIPVLTPEPTACLMTTYTPDRKDYLKIEFDYTGTMLMALGAAIMVIP